jgi:PAS domain S-box-containing protein
MRGLEERLRLALEGTETGFWEWEIASDTVEWSDNVGPMYGLPRGTQPEDAQAYLDRYVHPDDREHVQSLIRAAIETGIPYEHDLRVRHPAGGERFLHSRVHVVTGSDGRAERLLGLLSDVTDRRLREDRRAFLAEASEALATSMDPVDTLEEIARLAVPRLADWCSIQLAPEMRGAYEQIAVAHVDPDKVRWARELAERYPPDPDAPTGAPAVMRTGRAELYPVIDEALLDAAALDDEQRALVRELRMSSGMVVPLVARDRTLGAITFVFAESGRQYSTR